METAEKGELHGLLFASCVTVAAKTHFVQQSVHEINLHSLRSNRGLRTGTQSRHMQPISSNYPGVG